MTNNAVYGKFRLSLENYFSNRFSVFIIFSFLLSNSLYAGSKDSIVLQSDQDAVIYVSDGVSIYGSGTENNGKGIRILNISENKLPVETPRKPIKNKGKKIAKTFAKKEVTFKKPHSDKNIYDPLSTESSNNYFVFQRLKSNFLNINFQDYSHFLNTDFYLKITKRKFLSQNSIFYYSQNRNLCHFSQVFTVRPPPFS